MTPPDDSHLVVDGCATFRDAGGWPVATGGTMGRGLLLAATTRSGSPSTGAPPSMPAEIGNALAIVVTHIGDGPVLVHR